MSWKKKEIKNNHSKKSSNLKKKNIFRIFLAAFLIVASCGIISGTTAFALINSISSKIIKPIITLTSPNYTQTAFVKTNNLSAFVINATPNFNTTLKYQWYIWNNSNKNSILLSNEKTNTFLPNDKLTSNVSNNYFYVIVTGISPNGSIINAKSNLFTLKIINEPKVSFNKINTINATLNESNFQTIYSNAACNDSNIALTYQWYKSSSSTITSILDLSNGLIKNANNSAYTLQSSDVNTLGFTYYYLVVVGNIDGKTFYYLSSAYIVDVIKSATINITYNQNTIYGTKDYDGSTITANVVNSNSLPEQLQWYTNNPIYKNNNTKTININNTIFYAIKNANYEWYTLSTTDTSTVGTWYYFLQARSMQNGSLIISNNENEPIKLVVSLKPTITITDKNNFLINGYLNQTQDLILKPNITISTDSNNNQDSFFSYQWYSNDIYSNNNGTLLKSQTSNMLVLDASELNKPKLYFYIIVKYNIPNTQNGIISAISPVFDITLSSNTKNKISINNIKSEIYANNNQNQLVIYNDDLNNLPTLTLKFNQNLPNYITSVTNWYYSYNDNGNLAQKVLIKNNYDTLNLQDLSGELKNLWINGGNIYAISTIVNTQNNEEVEVKSSNNYNVQIQDIQATISYSQKQITLYKNQTTSLPTITPNIKYFINNKNVALNSINQAIRYQWYENGNIISTKTNTTANNSSYSLQTSDTNTNSSSNEYYLVIAILIDNQAINISTQNDNFITIKYTAPPQIEVKNNLPPNEINNISYYLNTNQSTNIPQINATISNSNEYENVTYSWIVEDLYTNQTKTYNTSSSSFNLQNILNESGKYSIWLNVDATIYGSKTSGNSKNDPFIIIINPSANINLLNKLNQSIQNQTVYNINATVNLNNLVLNNTNFNDWNNLNSYYYEIQEYSLTSSLSISSYNNLFNWNIIQNKQLIVFGNNSNGLIGNINFSTLVSFNNLPDLQYKIVIFQQNTNNVFISKIINVTPIFSSKNEAYDNLNELLNNPCYDMGLIWQYNINQTTDQYNNLFLNNLTNVSDGTSYQAVSGEYFSDKWWVVLKNIQYISANSSQEEYGLNYNASFNSFVLTYEITATQTIKNANWNTITTFNSGSLLRFYLPLNFFKNSIDSQISSSSNSYLITRNETINNNDTLLSWEYSSDSSPMNNLFFNLYHANNSQQPLYGTWEYPDISNLNFDSKNTIISTNGYNWSWLPIYNYNN